MKRGIAAGLLALATHVQAAPITLQENFDNLAASGWQIVNASVPVGATSWFQGNAGVFGAHSGAPDSYAAANFTSTSPLGGTISTWLISPEIQFASQLLTFYTRTDVDLGGIFGDGMRVLISTSGASTDLGDFVPLFDVNAANAPGGYPQDWTRYITQLVASGTGRIAFEYSVGPNALANYIGLDTINIAISEPPVLALLALAALLGAARARRRQPSDRSRTLP
jgi:hypothetical protein